MFLPYEHKEWIPGCLSHPGNIVEPASLAAIDSVLHDTADVDQTIPADTVKTGKLSSLQLESIIKAVSSLPMLS